MKADTMRSRRWMIAAATAGALAAVPSSAAAVPGDLDTQFGGTGIVTTDVVPGNHDDGASAATDGLGRVWAAGTSFGPAGERIALARYRPTGLDTTFGSGGTLSVSAGSGARGLDVIAYTHNVPGQGATTRALIAGSVLENGIHRPLVAAIRSNGVPDTTWSDDGLLSHAVPGATEVELTGIARDTGGQIVVAGRAAVAGHLRAFVARYTAEGSLDSTFSGDGMLTLRARRVINGSTVLANSTVVEDVVYDEAHDRIILVGSATYPGLPFDDDTSALAIGVRGDGTLDTLWGNAGMQHVGFGAGKDWFTSAAMQSAKVVLAGARNMPDDAIGYRQAAVTARLDANGHLDLTYGGGNGITRWHPGRHLTGTDVMVRGARIYVACSDTGGISDSNDDDTFTILRYTSNGDADFPWGGGDAEVRVNLNPGLGGYERANAVSTVYSTVNPSPPPRILVVGTAWPSQEYRFAAVSLRAS